jgi:hypothetical protein
MPLLAVFLLQRTAVGICWWRCVLGNFHGGECFLGEASKILFHRCSLGRQTDVYVTVPAAEQCCFSFWTCELSVSCRYESLILVPGGLWLHFD